MKTKRVLSLILVLTLILLALAGCGSKTGDTTEKGTNKTTAKDETTKDGTEDTTTEPDGTTSGEAGSEITNFVEAYMDAKEVVWTKMSEKIEETENYTAVMALLGFSFADLSLVLWPLFDVLDETGGVLMLTGIKNAYKRVDGNIISFGYDFTYEEDTESGSYKKGDVVKFIGEFDTARGCSKVETIDIQGGVIVSRLVSELVKNKEGSYSSQSVSYQSSSDKITGYFMTFDGEDVWSAIGEKEASEDFTVNSIYGVADASIEKMSAGFDITLEASFVGGESTVVQP